MSKTIAGPLQVPLLLSLLLLLPLNQRGLINPTSSIAPQSNLTSVANPNPISPGPPVVSIRDPSLDHDFDEVEFTGMWCTPVEAAFPADATVTCCVPEDIFLPLLTSALSILFSDPHSLLTIAGTKHVVIFDTGASLGITFDETGFDGPLTVPDGDLRLGGMAQGLKI
jgi:hypothetical protein